jgi:signal transduction histidine kinase
LSSAYLLSKYTKAEEQPNREKHIQRIVSSVTSLTEILNDFLSVGKIEEGNIVAKNTEYDVQQQMHEIIQGVQHLFKKGQHVDYKHEGNGSIVHLDSSMMRHIVSNLLSNAIKFSVEDSVVELTTRCDEGKLILSVKDNGIGIPEEDLQHLYRRFFRSSNVTNIQGTGLGLHIVSKYTELMNGEITCESKLGEGTTFTITFSQNK